MGSGYKVGALGAARFVGAQFLSKGFIMLVIEIFPVVEIPVYSVIELEVVEITILPLDASVR